MRTKESRQKKLTALGLSACETPPKPLFWESVCMGQITNPTTGPGYCYVKFTLVQRSWVPPTLQAQHLTLCPSFLSPEACLGFVEDTRSLPFGCFIGAEALSGALRPMSVEQVLGTDLPTDPDTSLWSSSVGAHRSLLEPADLVSPQDPSSHHLTDRKQGFKAMWMQSRAPWLLVDRRHVEESWDSALPGHPMLGCTREGAHCLLSLCFMKSWLHLVQLVHVSLRVMSECESGLEPQPPSPSSPLRDPKLRGWEKSGTSIYGITVQRGPAMGEHNTVLFHLHLQKQLLWLFLFFFLERFRHIKNNIL